MQMQHIVLFDGECLFCDKALQFILKRDPKGHFQFATLQSDVGKRLLHDYQVPSDVDSVVLIEGNRHYIKSTAGLRICRYLRGGWKVFYLLLIIPRPIRDFLYQIIAKNRYKWFGKKEACMLPSKDERKRFLT